jgi:hypothetical protein
VAFNLLTNIPLPALGLIFELIAALAGIGAVVIYIRGIFEGNGLFGRMERPIAVIPATSYLPPTAKDAALPPGMDNLPDGFTGFDENW